MSNEYPPDWEEIAKKIKRAARWRCEHCGHPNDRRAGYTLTVHHLDGDKSNCDWRNLVAMCQRCHLHWQGIWQPGQLWLIDPPEWAVRRGLAPGPMWWARMDELTPFDADLLRAIRARTAADGAARSLFDVAVVQGGLHYSWALYRLSVLEALGYVQVERTGPGYPLIMRLTA